MRSLKIKLFFIVLFPLLFVQMHICRKDGEFYPAIIYPSFATQLYDKSREHFVVNAYKIEIMTEGSKNWQPIEPRFLSPNNVRQSILLRKMLVPEACLMDNACLNQLKPEFKDTYWRQLSTEERQKRVTAFYSWVQDRLEKRLKQHVLAIRIYRQHDRYALNQIEAPPKREIADTHTLTFKRSSL